MKCKTGMIIAAALCAVHFSCPLPDDIILKEPTDLPMPGDATITLSGPVIDFNTDIFTVQYPNARPPLYDNTYTVEVRKIRIHNNHTLLGEKYIEDDFLHRQTTDWQIAIKEKYQDSEIRCSAVIAVQTDSNAGPAYYNIELETRALDSADLLLSQNIGGVYNAYTPIRNAEELFYLNDVEGQSMSASMKYLLLADISLEEPWVPLGSENHPFQGKFGGMGHTISGLKMITNPQASFDIPALAHFAGLFGKTDGAEIWNLRVVLDSTEPDYVYRWALDPTGDYFLGGIVGKAKDVTFKRVFVEGGVNIRLLEYSPDFFTGTFNTGGFAGQLENCTVTECASSVTGKINSNISQNANVYAGGFTGYSKTAGTIENCYSLGDVIVLNLASSDLEASCGGFIGRNEGTISKSYAAGMTANIVETGSPGLPALYTGGFAGKNTGTIQACAVTGKKKTVPNPFNLTPFVPAEQSTVLCAVDNISSPGKPPHRFAGTNTGALNSNFASSGTGLHIITGIDLSGRTPVIINFNEAPPDSTLDGETKNAPLRWSDFAAADWNQDNGVPVDVWVWENGRPMLKVELPAF